MREFPFKTQQFSLRLSLSTEKKGKNKASDRKKRKKMRSAKITASILARPLVVLETMCRVKVKLKKIPFPRSPWWPNSRTTPPTPHLVAKRTFCYGRSLLAGRCWNLFSFAPLFVLELKILKCNLKFNRQLPGEFNWKKYKIWRVLVHINHSSWALNSSQKVTMGHFYFDPFLCAKKVNKGGKYCYPRNLLLDFYRRLYKNYRYCNVILKDAYSFLRGISKIISSSSFVNIKNNNNNNWLTYTSNSGRLFFVMLKLTNL